MSNWWNKNEQFPLDNENFLKILEFYLIKCPCEIEKGSKKKGTKKYKKVSKRARTLRNCGWTGGYLNTLLASMKYISSGHLEYYLFDNKTDIEAEVVNIENHSTLSDNHFEMIVYSKRFDMNQTSAIYYYIRNALAHGSFSVVAENNNTIYYLESSKNDKVNAQIRLREDTLLKWINDFDFSPNALKSALANGRKKRKQNKKGNVAA